MSADVQQGFDRQQPTSTPGWGGGECLINELDRVVVRPGVRETRGETYRGFYRWGNCARNRRGGTAMADQGQTQSCERMGGHALERLLKRSNGLVQSTLSRV